MNQIELRKKFEVSSFREYHILSFEFNVVHTDICFFYNEYGNINILSENDSLEILYLELKEEIERNLLRLHLVMNLHSPGSLSFENGNLEINDKILTLDGYEAFSYQMALKKSIEYKWPIIQKVPIEIVMDWLSEVECFFLGITATQLERALIALTNSVEYSNEPASQLMWVMVGIENLYCSGKERMIESLHCNTEIFLGKRKEFKKSIKNMYKIRSRFIHGDLNFNAIHRNYNISDGIEISLELEDCIGLALAILVASLQKMAIEGRKELVFRTITKLYDNPSSNTTVQNMPFI